MEPESVGSLLALINADLDLNDDNNLMHKVLLILVELINKKHDREESEEEERLALFQQQEVEAELTMLMCLHTLVEKQTSHRRWWSLPKTRHFWEDLALPERREEFWLENFRMTRSTFMNIVDQLRPFIEKQVTTMRQPIAVEHRLAITLWRLATNIEYRTLGHLFGVGRSTVCIIVHETCRAIETHIMPKYIRFPEGQELLETVQRFGTKYPFPQVAGAIDGTHIPIKAPEDSPADYFNRKHFYSVVLQAVVDSDGKFIDTNVGRPGSVHDARVFSLSSFSRRLSNGTLFNPNPTKIIEGQEIPLLILGDPAYPLLPNLMKGYTGHGRLTREQRHFNYRLSSARFVVEHAFGRLKGRWRILNKKNDHRLDFIRPLVHACCTLHNICERNGDPFRNAWYLGINRINIRQNNQQRPVQHASRMREALKEYLKTR